MTIVEFSCELEKLRYLLGLLNRTVPDGLVTLSRLCPEILRDILLHVTYLRVPANFRVLLKHAFVKALNYDLPDGRLWESAGVEFLGVILASHPPHKLASILF